MASTNRILSEYLAPAVNWQRLQEPKFDLRAAVTRAEAEKSAQLDVVLETLDKVGRDLLSLADHPMLPEQFDQLISNSEEEERQIEERAIAEHKEILGLKKMARRGRPGWLPILNDFDLSVAARHQRLRMAHRDLRWQLMACRADHRREEKGPEFSDPVALREYLKSAG